MHQASFWTELTVVGRLCHGAHIIWSKQGVKQVTLCQCFDTNRADEVLEMDCLNESSADGWMPVWCVSHVVWSPHINYRCVSPLGTSLLAELKYSCCREHKDSSGFWIPALVPNMLQSFVGGYRSDQYGSILSFTFERHVSSKFMFQ